MKDIKKEGIKIVGAIRRPRTKLKRLGGHAVEKNLGMRIADDALRILRSLLTS